MPILYVINGISRPVRGVKNYVDNVATNLLRLHEMSMHDVLIPCLLRSQANMFIYYRMGWWRIA